MGNDKFLRHVWHLSIDNTNAKSDKTAHASVIVNVLP